MKTSLLKRFTSMGNTTFHALDVTSFTVLRPMDFVVRSLARKVRSASLEISWFRVSTSLISWQKHFCVRDTRSATSMSDERTQTPCAL